MQNGVEPKSAPQAATQPAELPKDKKEVEKKPTGHRLYAAFARRGEGLRDLRDRDGNYVPASAKKVGNANQSLLRRLKIGGV